MTVIDDPKISSIIPFLKNNPVQLEKSLINNQSPCIVDNMMLTKLRKDIITLPLIGKGFRLSDLIIIPDVILEEASANLPNELVFKAYYQDLFYILSQKNDIYVVDLDTLFQLLQRMIAKKDALSLLKNITLEAVRTNPSVSDMVRSVDVDSSNSLKDLHQSIMHNKKNTGERLITIMALVFLNLYFCPTYIFSEDEKGVYGPFKTFLHNERLMELINIHDKADFIEQYQFLSYESFIQRVSMEENLSKDELLCLVAESSRNQSRNILYSLDGHPCYTAIPNDQLAEWISQGRIQIQF